MSRAHHYALQLQWIGNTGTGTTSIRTYSRNHEITAPGLTPIAGSSDPAFRGEETRWNPEQLFVASLSQCHMLWYLALAAEAGVVVTDYVDKPTGSMVEESDGSGRFADVTLHPEVTITKESDLSLAHELHNRVINFCFIARSVSIPLRHVAVIIQS